MAFQASCSERMSSFTDFGTGRVTFSPGFTFGDVGTGGLTQWPAVAALMVLFLLTASWYSTLSASRGLNNIAGPWYGRKTTLHLKWGFARGTIWKYVEESHARYGDVVRLGPRQVWIASKSGIKAILHTVDLPKVTMYAEISRDRNSPGLFGEIRNKPHAKLKRFLGPAFTVSSVDKLDSYFKTCTATLLQNYYRALESSPGRKVKTDLMRDFHCLALDMWVSTLLTLHTARANLRDAYIMGESAFDQGFGQIESVFDSSKPLSAREKAWAKIPNAIFDGLAKRYQFVFFKRALRNLGINLEFDWPKEMTGAISELIDERADQTGRGRFDLLQHMLDEGRRPDTGERMTNQEIIDQMSELLLAGSETTSGTIGCLFLELARNPDVKDKLLTSLPVLGPEDAMLDSKMVREGKTYEYLEACIKENLRMHPIASEMGRRTTAFAAKIGDVEIPPYTVVSASYRCLHLDERYWPEPNRFWPERWLQGEACMGAPPPDTDAYYPFSAGKHNCIGQNFAMAEIRTVSANLLSRFNVEEHCYKGIDFRQFITMQFHDGSWHAELTPRWTTAA